MNPLEQAILNSNPNQLRLLLKLGHNPDQKNENGNSLLCIAIEQNALTCVEGLITGGANVNEKGIFKFSPLHLAVYYKNREAFHLLIKYNEDLNSRVHEARTPLHAAIEKQNSELAASLIENGADIHARDIGGKTPAVHRSS